MKFPRLLFLHAALVLAGWGIVAALEPRRVTGEAIAPTKTSARDERARREGEKILRQMEAALPTPETPEPVSPEEGTYEERLREFAELKYTWLPDRALDRWVAVVFARSKISGIVFGERGPDLSYAFFQHRMEASEIISLLSQQFPEHGKDHALQEALFSCLAPFDPTRATELLDPLSPADRGKALFSLGLSSVGEVHPEIWREITELNSASSDREWIDRREQIWAWAADQHLRRFGDSYLPWVLDLPPEAERELAISATASKLKEIDPAAAARFLKSAEASASGNR